VEFLTAFLTGDFLGKAVWLWLTFIGIVLFLLAFDLGVLNKSDKELGIAESLKLSVFYIAIAVAFGAWIWWSMGPTPACSTSRATPSRRRSRSTTSS
jgi:tellurite resistance protein TerC